MRIFSVGVGEYLILPLPQLILGHHLAIAYCGSFPSAEFDWLACKLEIVPGT